MKNPVEDVVWITKDSFTELSALLLHLVSRADAGEGARRAYSAFVERVVEENPDIGNGRCNA